jgi:hypothetical protein
MLLGEKNKGAPSQARLRRAISTAYYGLFHSIARSAADAFVGGNHRSSARYETVYRGFEHSQMKRCCVEVDKATLKAKTRVALGVVNASQEIRDVANAFVTLQQRRHWADYSPRGKITRAETLDLVDLAVLAMAQLTAAEPEERKNFVAYLLMDARD